jgi:RNA polymerase sigma-70 factor (ECF subfamily)
MAEITEDQKLIKQYLKGDEKSLELLIEKYLKMIYGFVYKNVGSVSDAEDITQEIFVKIWKNIKKFDQNKNFKPWLFQIAKNTSIDFLRKKKTIPFSRFENDKGQNILIDTLADDQPDLMNEISDKKVLNSAIKILSTKEQLIIKLRHDEGRSFQEIADHLKESINTVKSRYRRALVNMRKNIRN